jgi:hypothetical protein
MKTIVSTNGFDIIVDDEDFDSLSAYSWWVNLAKGKPTGCTRSTRVDGKPKTIHMHRELTNAPKGMVVDHINRNPIDNRKINLRVVTQSENQKNRGMDNRVRAKSSVYKGVSKCPKAKSVRWLSVIVVNRKLNYIGIFKEEVLAAEAYDNAADLHFGEYGYRNFPKIKAN